MLAREDDLAGCGVRISTPPVLASPPTPCPREVKVPFFPHKGEEEARGSYAGNESARSYTRDSEDARGELHGMGELHGGRRWRDGAGGDAGGDGSSGEDR